MIIEHNIIRTIVGLGILVFLAKVLGGLCAKLKIPEVVGEVFAGIIFGPYALGGMIHIFGGQLVELNDITLAFAEMGAIIVLFAIGLEMTFSDFRSVGGQGFVIGAMGVILPFLLGYFPSIYLGYSWSDALIVGAALTATSIAITARTLNDLGKLNTPEGKLIINSAIIDDVLGLSVLAIVISLIYAGGSMRFSDVALISIKALGLWLIMLIAGVYILPKFIHLSSLWSANRGMIEAAATASCFGFASLATFMGLSPIVGAFAAGMAIAGSNLIKHIMEYVKKLELIFGPLFFAVIGAQFDIGQVWNIDVSIFFLIFLLAVFSKIVGCGLPAAYFSRDIDHGLKVGISMVSRGEVGFIVAGIGLATGLLNQEIYATILLVIMVTTMITPILLERLYRRSS